MNVTTLKGLFNYSIDTYSNNKCLCTTEGGFYTYKQMGNKVKEISILLLNNSINFGEKIGILSQNMPNWGVAFMSCVAYGRVAVPMLPDFSESEIANIVAHSECKGIFISKKLYYKLTKEVKEQLSFIVELDSFSILKGENIEDKNINELEGAINTERFTPKEKDLATIIYTSGTTGNSKGVMLSHKNLVSHLYSAMAMRPSFEWDVWLSILPLSHTLECSLSLLLPISAGSSIYYLDKAPTPSVLLKALKIIKPTTLLVVPLIIEKIYKNSILPKVNAKPLTAKLYKTTIGRKLMHFIIGKEMVKMFGGRMRFFGIGGAKLDGTVERFLLEAKFPYAIGYGLTECSPLLAGAAPKDVKWQTTGPAVPGVTIKISNPDPITGEGEVIAKGDNIMAGYYKNSQATADAFTSDGWFRTKDLGYIDSKGWLSIRGRLNNMIVGASGENIYPEEIETVINSHILVAESLVTAQSGVLVANVCLNPDKMEALNKLKNDCVDSYTKRKIQLIESYEQTKEEWLKEYGQKKGAIGLKKDEWKREYDQKRRDLYRIYAAKRNEAVALYNDKKAESIKLFDRKLKELENEIHDYVNSKVNKFSKVAIVKVQQEAFQKTATQKIKRYLYKK
ncbi:MAG: AMP-binding protein [Bacteroidales bacterium]